MGGLAFYVWLLFALSDFQVQEIKNEKITTENKDINRQTNRQPAK